MGEILIKEEKEEILFSSSPLGKGGAVTGHLCWCGSGPRVRVHSAVSAGVDPVQKGRSFLEPCPADSPWSDCLSVCVRVCLWGSVCVHMGTCVSGSHMHICAYVSVSVCMCVCRCLMLTVCAYDVCACVCVRVSYVCICIVAWGLHSVPRAPSVPGVSDYLLPGLLPSFLPPFSTHRAPGPAWGVSHRLQGAPISP